MIKFSKSKTAAMLAAPLCAMMLAACANYSAFTKCDEGWKPLFDASLDNAIYEKGVWSVSQDGVLQATQDKVIFTKDDHENFELSLDFKIEKDANSGVVIYCTDVQKWIPNSLEIQICDNTCEKFSSRGATWLTGALFGHAAPSKLENSKPLGEWNNMRLRCVGQQIDVWVNGDHINSINLSKWTQKEVNPDGTKIPTWLTSKIKSQIPTNGKIGLQGKHGGATCDYKNVMIRPAQAL